MSAEGKGGGIAFRDVACRRGGRWLFTGLSFAAGAGGAVLVTGPNGTGKSSMIRIAAGLLKAVSGTVEVAGPAALAAEAAALDPELPLGRALAFWARMDGRPDPAARVADGLAAMRLEGIAAVPVRMLSTGQRRRAAIARVIASGAPTWLLDEPASGLDIAAIAALEAAIARHRAGGGTVLVATHQPVALPDAETVALGAAP